MRLDLRVGTMAAAAALCLPVVAYGQRPVVEGMSQRLTVACGTEGAKVQGMGNTVTLTGACATVLVEGSDNTVHIATLGRLTVAGMNNKVYWTSGIDGATPKITKEGVGNTVEKKTPADSAAPAATAADDAIDPTPSSGGGTATATASTPTSSHDRHGHAGQPDADRRLRWQDGRDGRGRRRPLGERDEAQPARPEPAAGTSAAARPASARRSSCRPTSRSRRWTARAARSRCRATRNRLTLKGRVRADHGRRQREHPRRRLDDADRHVRQPQRREVPRAGQRQGTDRHLGRHRQPRLERRSRSRRLGPAAASPAAAAPAC